MRNAPLQQMPQQQPQLNESVANVRSLMSYLKGTKNKEEALASFLQTNPATGQIAQMLRNSGSLEAVAKQMAQAKNIDLNELINQLQQ